MIISIFAITFLTSCGEKKLVLQVSVEGSLKNSGVINYLGYEMNVYKDEADNPCGDCPLQPVCLYKGADGKEVAGNIAKALKESNGDWEVEVNKNIITLKEKEKGCIDEIQGFSGPEGISFKEKIISGHAKVIKASENIENVSADETIGFSDPESIAALYGPSYEMLTVLGAEDRIVVRADVQTDSFPWAKVVFKRIKDVPEIENVHSLVNVEEVLGYSPDFVYTFPRQNELAQLKKAGVMSLAGKSFKKLSDTPEFLIKYAKTLNKDALKKAREYQKYYREKLKEIKSVSDNLKEEEKPVVYYAGVDILTTYGNQSDMVEVIEAAGGKAASANLDAAARTQISYEQLAKWNPDVIFIDHGGMNDGKTGEEIKENLFSSKAYKDIEAVKKGKVYLSPSGVFYWDMGLQKILLVEYMAKTLHPKEYESLDMNSELRSFYKKFYNYSLSKEDAEKILNREEP